MYRGRFMPLLLVALLLVGSLWFTAVPVTGSSETIYVFILPTEVPKNTTIAEATIDLLIEINKLAVEDRITAYWIIEAVSVDKLYIPPGSIIVKGSPSIASKLAKFAASHGIEVYELRELPHVKAILIKPPKIAILDYGVTSTLFDVLRALGFDYVLLPNKSITELLTGKYDLFILPPGSGTRIARALGIGGAKIVARFVAEGGGLIGVCAGAYAVAKGYNEPTTWIQLVDAKVINYPTWALGGGIVYVDIVDPKHPVMYGFRGTIKMIYWNGPILRPFDLGNDTTLGIDVELPKPLAIYVKPSEDRKEFIPGWDALPYDEVAKTMKDGYAVLYAEYGLGKIVLFSVHPELTEGPSDTPKAKLGTRYTWRMLWQAIYFVAGKRVTLGAIVGVWMWPLSLRYTYQMVLEKFYGGKELSLEEKREAFRKACEIVAEELASYGITDVFLLVKGTAGKLVFPSEVGKKYSVPMYNLEPYNITDIVKVFAEELHKKGIRLHAWIVVYMDRVWGPRDPMYHCGKWKDSTYVEPYPVTSRVRLFNETYQNYIAELAKELVEKHDVDGIHLDYIRWPHVVYSFSPKDFELARARGIDLAKVHRYIILTYYGMPNESIPAQKGLIFEIYREKSDPDVVKWFELRREAVFNITNKVAEAVRSVKPDAILSAALMPDAADDYLYHFVHYGQRYEDFAKLGYWLIPMAYHREYGRTVDWVEKVSSFASSIAKKFNTIALTGIQCFGGVSFDEVTKATELAMRGGSEGWVYFRFGLFLPLAWDAMMPMYRDEMKELYDTVKKLILGSIVAGREDLEEKLSRIAFELELMLSDTKWFQPNPRYVVTKLRDALVPIAKPLALEIEKRIADLVAKAREVVPGYSLLLNYVMDRVHSITEAIARSEDIAEISKLFDTLTAQTLTVALTLASYEELSELNKTVSGLRLYIEGLDKSLADLKLRVEIVDKVATALKKRIDELEKRLIDTEKSIREELAKLGKKYLDALKTLSDRVDKLESYTKTLERSLSDTQHSIESLRSRADKLEKALSTLEKRVEDLHERSRALESRASSMEKSVDELSSRVESIEKELEDLKSSIGTATGVAIVGLVLALIALALVAYRLFLKR